MSLDDLREHHAAWCKSLQQAIQADAWGQVLEAVEAYERLASAIEQLSPQCHELTPDQKLAVERVARSAELRAKCLSSVDGERDSPTKEDMEQILALLRGLLTEDQPVFPLDLADATTARAAAKSSTVQIVEADDNDTLEDYAECGATKPQLNRVAGSSYFDLEIFRVGLKDATSYVNPTIVVSVFDRDGKQMEEPKETTVGSSGEPQHIRFHKALVQLEASVELMEECGAAVFFEVCHYKAKKRKKSCRCWSLLEMDEVKNDSGGPRPLALELYQKPIDPKRKRIHLFTVKELFLHVQVRVTAV